MTSEFVEAIWPPVTPCVVGEGPKDRAAKRDPFLIDGSEGGFPEIGWLGQTPRRLERPDLTDGRFEWCSFRAPGG